MPDAGCCGGCGREEDRLLGADEPSAVVDAEKSMGNSEKEKSISVLLLLPYDGPLTVDAVDVILLVVRRGEEACVGDIPGRGGMLRLLLSSLRAVERCDGCCVMISS